MRQTPWNFRYISQANLSYLFVDNGQVSSSDTIMPPFDNRGIVMPTQSNASDNSGDHLVIRDCGIGLCPGDIAAYGIVNCTLNRVGIAFEGLPTI